MRRLATLGLVVLLAACGGSPTAPTGRRSFDNFLQDYYGFGNFCLLDSVDVASIELGVGEETVVRIPDVGPADLMGEHWPRGGCPTSLEGARFESYYWFESGLVNVEIESCNCENIARALDGQTRLRMFEPMSLEIRVLGVAPGDGLVSVTGATYDLETNPAGFDGALADHNIWITVR